MNQLSKSSSLWKPESSNQKMNQFKQKSSLQLKAVKLLQVIFNQLKQEKDYLIRDLTNKNKKLDDQVQRISSLSQNDSQDKKSNKSQNKKQDTITKENFPNFIKNSSSTFNFAQSLRSLISLQKPPQNKQKQYDALIKIWQKQISEHILPKSRIFSFSSLITKQLHRQKFLKTTFLLVKKNLGVPHIYRNKVWEFISEDKLQISNSLYIELLDRRRRGWVSENIKKQIQKDINRSFNGEATKQKLQKIHNLALQRIVSQHETLNQDVSIRQKQNSFQKNRLSQQVRGLNLEDLNLKRDFSIQQAGLQNIQKEQSIHKTKNQNFRISQDATQVLQLFYIYRPDIGFVQGMTYPTIVLTLITGKINAFKILCNLLLCNQFFRRMITFEPNFINYFCRIFDQLLLSQNLALYNLIFKQLEIRSQVFLVDWFYTFFSRGISPNTILRIWDLMLYQNAFSMKNSQLVLYKVSLTIFSLLEAIIMQTTYEECIRTIREYSKKIDQQELIKKVYQQLKDSSNIKQFQQKYNKVKLKVQKKYYLKNPQE